MENLATEPWVYDSSHRLVPIEPGAPRVATEKQSLLREILVYGWPQQHRGLEGKILGKLVRTSIDKLLTAMV